MAVTNTFAGAGLDRAGERRTDDAWIAARIRDPSSRAIVIGRQGPWLDGDRPALVPVPPEAEVLLGVDGDGTTLFAIPEDSAPAGGGTPVNLRDAAARMPATDAGLVAYATSLLNWHRTHPFCARCGSPTHVTEAGHLRSCPNCGATHHPRTDPVVIMLVHDPEADRVLLGRQPTWPAGRFSALAGFVEPGESLEDAVAREVREEAGVEVTGLSYRSSQPWPFPAQLMLGFHARYAGGQARTNDEELEEVRWFPRAELADIAAGATDMHIPPPAAIARRLIDEWLEEAR